LKQKLWTIRQDSGFHKKRIVDVLSGSNKMFFGMGYRASPNMPQMLFFTQHGDVQTPVNINKAQVLSVARDCLLAYVECHLLEEIHHIVAAQF